MGATARGSWAGRARRAAARDVDALVRLVTQREERRALAQGLREGELSAPRRHALVVLALLAALALWVTGTVALRASMPGAVQTWDAGWGMLGVAFATSAGVPGSYVVPLLFVTPGPPQLAAVAGAAAGSMAGAVVAHTVGGKVREKLEAWERKGKWAKAFLAWSEGAVRRWGFGALFVFMAVPGLPDSLPIYFFSLLGLRMGPFLVTAFLGSLARSTITLLIGLAALQRLGLAP